MRFSSPHPIPYQGSKRLLAPMILSFVPANRYRRLIEPFIGSGAVTLAAAGRRMFKRYLLSDVLSPLCHLWETIVTDPDGLSDRYAELWEGQKSDPVTHYNWVRAQFNQDRDPAMLLFLLARCVKNAVRFNPRGDFNQSSDKRRLGTRPSIMTAEIKGASGLLSGRCEIRNCDFKKMLASARETDLVYMDPPYQGTSAGRDSRYVQGVKRDDLIAALDDLNRRGVQFILSYDGACGDKIYGEALPASLHLHRVLVDAGRSAQATLNGGTHRTVESIYLSPGLRPPDASTSILPASFVSEQTRLFQQA